MELEKLGSHLKKKKKKWAGSQRYLTQRNKLHIFKRFSTNWSHKIPEENREEFF